MIFFRMLNRSADTLAKIYNHTYNQQLHNGTLPRQSFRAYLEQDRLYLADLAIALKFTAARLDDEKHRQAIQKLSDEAIHYESSMQQEYIAPPATTPLFPAVIKKIKPVEDYTAHLLTAAEKLHPAVAMATLLPCFWSYCNLGRQMIKQGVSDQHPYRKWILSYADEEYINTVEQIRGITEALGNIATPAIQEEMLAAFETSSRYELAFYDAVYPNQPELTMQNTLTLAS
jgi:thiaminase